MPNRYTGNSKYRYSFNGMEKDNEIAGDGNSFSTHFRQYDTRIGRWLSIDPVFHENLSPYNAFDGNPIYYTDPSGADSERPPYHGHWGYNGMKNIGRLKGFTNSQERGPDILITDLYKGTFITVINSKEVKIAVLDYSMVSGKQQNNVEAIPIDEAFYLGITYIEIHDNGKLIETIDVHEQFAERYNKVVGEYNQQQYENSLVYYLEEFVVSTGPLDPAEYDSDGQYLAASTLFFVLDFAPGDLPSNRGGGKRKYKTKRNGRIKSNKKFGDLKSHAANHSDLSATGYYNHAVVHTDASKYQFKVRHDGKNKINHVTPLENGKYLFTSTNKSGKRIYTHMEVDAQYLKNKGITIPK